MAAVLKPDLAISRLSYQDIKARVEREEALDKNDFPSFCLNGLTFKFEQLYSNAKSPNLADGIQSPHLPFMTSDGNFDRYRTEGKPRTYSATEDVTGMYFPLITDGSKLDRYTAQANCTTHCAHDEYVLDYQVKCGKDIIGNMDINISKNRPAILVDLRIKGVSIPVGPLWDGVTPAGLEEAIAASPKFQEVTGGGRRFAECRQMGATDVNGWKR